MARDLSAADVAGKLGRSRRDISDLFNAGKIRGSRIHDRKFLFDLDEVREDLDDLLKEVVVPKEQDAGEAVPAPGAPEDLLDQQDIERFGEVEAEALGRARDVVLEVFVRHSGRAIKKGDHIFARKLMDHMQVMLSALDGTDEDEGGSDEQ